MLLLYNGENMFFVKVLTCLLILAGINVKSNGFDKFEEKVNDSYYSYYEYKNISEEDYELVIIKGICLNEPCYGIVFKSNKEYELILEIDGLLYSLNENESEGYYEALCIKADINIGLRIYDTKGNSFKINNIEHSQLPKFSKNSLSEEALFIGLNNCKEFSVLNSYALKIPNYIIIILIIFAIIGAALTWILVMWIMKKGKFKEELRKALNDDIEIENNIYQEAEVVHESNMEVSSEGSYQYDDEIEFDINEYLIEHGYKSDYSLYSKEEKEKLTMELMKLKEEKQINEDDYYGEIYKIWK